jgi:DNA invertase Pin-like site-specific DNA recombinase
MLIGYARVSTNEQHLDLQRDALRKAGVAPKDIYTDKVTGVKAERPGLQAALSHLRPGDTFIVWRLDRLGRSLNPTLTPTRYMQELMLDKIIV